MHSRTTAPEIIEAFEGEKLDYWVTGFGTGGTLKGVARVLKKERPETKVIVCEPDNSQLLGSGIPQPRGADGSPTGSHPLFRPHLMQGWSPDFIPKLTEDSAHMIICFAVWVTFSRSFAAPVVTSWKTSSSAARPPRVIAI